VEALEVLFKPLFIMSDNATKTIKVENQKLRIKITSYDSKIIDIATKTIIDTAERNSVKVVGPVPLPTSINKYSVNRATFVHKTAQEQFEMRTHKRLIDIVNPTPKAIDALMNLNLPSGVDLEIKMM